MLRNEQPQLSLAKSLSLSAYPLTNSTVGQVTVQGCQPPGVDPESQAELRSQPAQDATSMVSNTEERAVTSCSGDSQPRATQVPSTYHSSAVTNHIVHLTARQAGKTSMGPGEGREWDIGEDWFCLGPLPKKVRNIRVKAVSPKL